MDFLLQCTELMSYYSKSKLTAMCNKLNFWYLSVWATLNVFGIFESFSSTLRTVKMFKMCLKSRPISWNSTTLHPLSYFVLYSISFWGYWWTLWCKFCRSHVCTFFWWYRCFFYYVYNIHWWPSVGPDMSSVVAPSMTGQIVRYRRSSFHAWLLQ